MREQCIPHLVESWFQILQTYQQSHPELTCQCLEVVGAYVSWIDLNLIANDRLAGMIRIRNLTCFCSHRNKDGRRDSASSCCRKMKPKYQKGYVQSGAGCQS